MMMKTTGLINIELRCVFIAKPRSEDGNAEDGCDGNSTRLKISVRCKKSGMKTTRSAGIQHRRSRRNKRRLRRKRRRSTTPAPLLSLMPTPKLNSQQEAHISGTDGGDETMKNQVVELKIKTNAASRRSRTLEPRGNTFLGFLLQKLSGKFMRLMKLST